MKEAHNEGWVGQPEPPYWVPLDSRVNSSLAGQNNRYTNERLLPICHSTVDLDLAFLGKPETPVAGRVSGYWGVG
jgi:hypothetical protein